jgi:hypothetical protein
MLRIMPKNPTACLNGSTIELSLANQTMSKVLQPNYGSCKVVMNETTKTLQGFFSMLGAR